MTAFKGRACQEEGDRVLLVEGKNDCHVVMALLRAREVSRSFAVYECGSYDGVLQRLNALILDPRNLTAVGVILDANQVGSRSRWQAVRDKLGRYSYSFPRSMTRDGMIIEGGEIEPTLGVWIMPDNDRTGSIEDFCLELVQEEELKVVDSAIELGVESGVAQFKPTHRSKARIHTYLAWQDEPGKPMGQSIAGGRLRSAGPSVDSFLGWLGRLFDF